MDLDGERSFCFVARAVVNVFEDPLEVSVDLKAGGTVPEIPDRRVRDFNSSHGDKSFLLLKTVRISGWVFRRVLISICHFE